MSRDVAIVSGYLIRCPLGGYAWQNLHYLLGLRALGFDAYFYEDTVQYSYCFEPRSGNMTDDPSAGVEFAARFFAAHGLGERWIFEDTWRRRCFGLTQEARDDVVQRARLWISLAAVNRLPEAWRGRPGTAFVDIDPGYTQIQAASGDRGLLDLLGEHRTHFTIGEHIGTPTCAVPNGGFTWRPTRQPVALSLWDSLPPQDGAAYTTVGRWDEQRREVEVAGERYSWRKRSEWMKFLDLPARTGERFRLAMDVAKNADDLSLLAAHGWEVVDPLQVSADADAYREFIRQSKGEFTVAKDLNVRLRTGWFSDRAVCYLAAGRPVINQQTGFDTLFPAGRGLHGFLSLDEAIDAFAEVRQDYAAESVGARRLAADYFDAARVLKEMIDAM
jgi:hypothetical protein